MPETNPKVKTMSGAELLAELDRLRAENAKLAAAATSRWGPGITCKRSDKGAVSVYGLGRFPVTLYADQWSRLFGAANNISAFIKANDSTLAHKS